MEEKANLVLPIFYGTIDRSLLFQNYSGDSYLLFVGADFFANTEGAIWFIEKVMPKVNVKLYIAGSCCKTIEKKITLTKESKTTLLGFVDDLDVLYKQAAAVVCPIFTGSGMKTKTIEALRYGKSIFGTTEAFIGVDADYNKVGGLCNTAEEFINSIQNYFPITFNEFSYNLFVENYSEKVVYNQLRNYLEHI